MMMLDLNTLSMMFNILNNIKILFIYSLFFSLLGCTEHTDNPYYEAQGSSQSRIIEVSKHLNLPIEQKSALLDSVLDAQLFEERMGTAGGIGSSDYCRFFALSIQPQAIEAWRSLLMPKSPDTWSHYPTPAQPKSWWVTEPVYKTLTMFDAYNLIHLNGSVGIEASGKIYIHACTD
jgi:hypothetical protein